MEIIIILNVYITGYEVFGGRRPHGSPNSSTLGRCWWEETCSRTVEERSTTIVEGMYVRKEVDDCIRFVQVKTTKSYIRSQSAFKNPISQRIVTATKVYFR